MKSCRNTAIQYTQDCLHPGLGEELEERVTSPYAHHTNRSRSHQTSRGEASETTLAARNSRAKWEEHKEFLESEAERLRRERDHQKNLAEQFGYEGPGPVKLVTVKVCPPVHFDILQMTLS